jgi:hypothetical protein
MTITSFSIIYGGIVPYSKIWNSCHPDEEWQDDNDDQREWVSDYLHYRSQSGPVPDYLHKFHRQVQRKFLNHPMFSVFAMNIPHDQVHEFDEKEGDYGAIGMIVFPEKGSCFWKDFEVEPNKERYAEFLEKFEGTLMYDFLKDPKMLIIQDDCGCCS